MVQLYYLFNFGCLDIGHLSTYDKNAYKFQPKLVESPFWLDFFYALSIEISNIEVMDLTLKIINPHNSDRHITQSP